MVLQLGDPCVIWNGESPIGDPLSWLFGVVVKIKPGMISMISSWKIWKEGGKS